MKSLRVTAMDHIVLNVHDIDRSLDFYTNVLGLGGERIEEYRRGEVGFPSVRINEGTLIDLMVAPGESDAAATQRNLNHFCLVAAETDLTAVAGGLRDAGVTVTQDPVSR